MIILLLSGGIVIYSLSVQYNSLDVQFTALAQALSEYTKQKEKTKQEFLKIREGMRGEISSIQAAW